MPTKDIQHAAASAGLVMACVPYFRCPRHVCRAVESLLAQTYQNLCVVVVNDGDPCPPWKQLSHIRDPRLVRFNLTVNRGPYFAMGVALNATAAPYFLVQDADDWSASTRVQQLLAALERDRSDLAVSAQPQYVEENGQRRVVDVLWRHTTATSPKSSRMAVQTTLGSEFAYRVPHVGLFRSSLLRQVGGYYGGFRVAYDTLLTNLILMTGRISHVPAPLYWRLIRSNSLTHSKTTGNDSDFARRTNAEIRRIYHACYAWYTQFLLHRISKEQLKRGIRLICTRRISSSDQRALALESRRLYHLLTMERRAICQISHSGHQP